MWCKNGGSDEGVGVALWWCGDGDGDGGGEAVVFVVGIAVTCSANNS